MSRIGVYRFEEHSEQIKNPIRGRVAMTHDSVYVDADAGPCTYDPASQTSVRIIYHCNDVTFLFDRDDPLNRSTYSTTGTVIEHQTNCARYKTDTQGRQTCIQQQTDNIEHQIAVNGKLHFIAIAKPD